MKAKTKEDKRFTWERIRQLMYWQVDLERVLRNIEKTIEYESKRLSGEDLDRYIHNEFLKKEIEEMKK